MFHIPGTIHAPARFLVPAATHVPVPPPSWVPTADGIVASLFADFTTEGSGNNYWYNNATYGSFASLLSALSGTFSRSSTGYYFNSSGVLTSASSNVLRFDYDPSTLAAKGILLEGSRTNLMLQSNTLNNASWSTGGITWSSTTTGPDGVSSSLRLLLPNAGAGNHFIDQTFTCSVGVTYAHSIIAKAGGYNWLLIMPSGASSVGVWFDLQNGVVGTQSTGFTGLIQNLGGGIYRCTALFTETGTTGFMQFAAVPSNGSGINYSADGVSGVYCGFVQVEAGSAASSYIPTTTTTATRAADSLTWPYSSLTSGTFLAKSQQTAVSVAQRLLQLDDGSASNRISLSANASAAAALDVLSGGVSQAALTNGTYSANTLAGAAAAFAANNFGLSKSGAAASTSASGSMPTGMTTMRVGQDASGATNVFGNVAQIGVWNSLRASNSALQSLST